MGGKGAAHLSDKRFVNRSETDEMREVTVNKDTKIPGTPRRILQ